VACYWDVVMLDLFSFIRLGAVGLIYAHVSLVGGELSNIQVSSLAGGA
jgi:hypothetical protein